MTSYILVLIFSILIIPINTYWLIYTTTKWYAPPTSVALHSNVIFIIFIYSIAVLVYNRLFHKQTGKSSNRTVMFIMLSLSTAISGYHWSMVLIPQMSSVFWFATPENEWRELIWPHVPQWLTVSDKAVLRNYYQGESTLYTMQHIKAWFGPVMWWSGFAIVLTGTALCINTLIRRQWTEVEKLSYPIIQLPLEMTRPASTFFSNKRMWIGFGIAVAISLINGLHVLYPVVPYIPVKRRYFTFFTEKPWNAMGSVIFAFYPFVIGICFLMPLDLAFSCLFFYVFVRGERIAASAMGLRALPRFPYISEQAYGAYISLFVLVFWIGRAHIRRVMRMVFRTVSGDKREEAMQYRFAMAGLVIGLILLFLFAFRMGMSLWAIGIFFGMYFVLSIVVSRMRAELGFPGHHLPEASPYLNLVSVAGARRLGPANLTGNTLFAWFSYFQASNPMVYQLEGFKLAERTNMSFRRASSAMILSMVVSIPLALWIWLHICYRIGASESYLNWLTDRHGVEYTYSLLQRILAQNTGTDIPALIFMGIGFAFASTLMLLRMRFFWLPFHPIGYALGGSWIMSNIYTCLFVSTLLKWIVLKFGGFRMYRSAVPFFLGLILGDFIMGQLWFIYGTISKTLTYSYWL